MSIDHRLYPQCACWCHMHNPMQWDNRGCNYCGCNLNGLPKYKDGKYMGLTRDRTNEDEKIIEMNKGLSCEPARHDSVNHPSHYNNHPAKCECGRRIECINITRHLSFNVGNAIKYLWRCDLKNSPVEDLRKAVWYIQDEIKERLKNGN